jgi:tetratricopeptide (TPR) repeat protein
MPSPNDGLALLKAGRLAEAEAVYREILQSDPSSFEARHFLGLAQYQRGDYQNAAEQADFAVALNANVAATHNLRAITMLALRRFADALASFDHAIALDPNDAGTLTNRGIALKELGRLDEAVASHDRAIARDPAFAEAFNNRGFALLELDRPDAALADFDQAIALQPDYAAALKNQASAFSKLKRHTEALASCDRALTLDPHDAETLINRGTAFMALGRFADALASYDRATTLDPDNAAAVTGRANASRALGRSRDALADYDRALALDPALVSVWISRSDLLRELGRFGEALASCERAVALDPNSAAAFSMRGVALKELGRLGDAVDNYDRAIAIDPLFAEAFNNRGVALVDLRRIDEALASYDRALELDPDYVAARKNRAFCNLLIGRYAEGWPGLEPRLPTSETECYDRLTFPSWQGEDPDGRRLLVYSEQGIGDVIQFARYLPLLAARRCRLTFLTYPLLVRLFQPLTHGIEVVTALDDQHMFDAQCSLMSLPCRFATDLTSIPDVSYLRAEAPLAARWGERIGHNGFKVGIVWQGNPRQKRDRVRSIPLRAFCDLATLPGVRLISLQRHHGLEQLAQLPDGVTIETLGHDIIGGTDAFADTAAVMSNLDLIITSCTAVAHLAGALGRPTWIVLDYAADWRWLLDRDDSPWYPTVRLFRQPRPGDWASAFADVKRSLEHVSHEPSVWAP